MIISGEQIWNNIFLIIVIALVIELAVSGLFSIKYIEELAFAENFKNVLIIVIAFGLCAKIPELRILYKSRIAIPDLIHMVMTALILSRIVSLFHDWFLSLKAKSGL